MKRPIMEVQVSFLVGTSFQDACEEAKRYAIKNDLAHVKFNFNGISVAISQVANIEQAWAKFLEVSKEGSKFKFVVA